MPSRTRARGKKVVAAVSAVTALALFAGCAVGPDTGPDIVRGDNPGADVTETPRQPELGAPERDLNWKPCEADVAKRYDAKVPDGITVECASYDMPVDPDGDDRNVISVGAMRASKSGTPRNAVPLVLTSGTDLPSSRTLLSLAGHGGAGLLDRHPIVAVDFRGTGIGSTVDCLSNAQRDVIGTNAAGPRRDAGERAADVGTAARAAADLCTETLSPDQLSYSITAAAADLEGLRDRWGVERLALIGVGDGSSVALRYAAAHPDNVGRLVLDSPTGYNVAAREASAARAQGLQKSLQTWAQRCAGAGCELGADGAAMLGRVVSAGAAGDLDGISDTEVLAAVTTSIAVDDADRAGLRRLGAAIADADRGDTAALRGYVDQARSLRGTDGRLVGRCNDLRGRPGLQEIPGLAEEWSRGAPLTALSTALDLADCDGWGSTDAPAAPESLPVNPLILIGANDPFNGASAVETLSPLLVGVDAAPTSVTWDGLGFSVLAHSSCAGGILDDYLGAEPLKAPAQRACPA
ncbi:alpha/beta fold hydrolase [Gordonia zhaorongruii]|uniref:alpha/beta fold hydrolase n=1 Tax=Gordonia zhaorongruii TaxID=2597659 RepID=UPI00104A4FE2|nr:alpha/beta hydrolase [Gordonia zhaorongruii]